MLRLGPAGFIYWKWDQVVALLQTIRCEVTLNPSAGSRERIMNVWHIANISPSSVGAALTDFHADLDNFYQAIDVYLSNELTGAVPTVRYFSLIEPKPRQPVAELDLSALSTGSDRYMREACMCLSYKAEYVSGVTPKRRRGRIYIGPLSSSCVSTTTGKLAAGHRGALVTAGQALFDAQEASGNYSWVVYSPTTDTAGTGEVGMYEVVGAWVDDEIDTQRRRGMPQPGVKYLIS